MIDSMHYAVECPTSEGRFVVLKNLGRDSAGIKAFPVTKDFRKIPVDMLPYVQYNFYSATEGTYKLYFYLEPTNPVYNDLEMEKSDIL